MTSINSMSGRPLHVNIPPSGDGPASLPAMTPPRKLGNGRASPTSPLKLFGQAKKKINDIFIDISDYVKESTDFLDSITQSEDIVPADLISHVGLYTDRVKGIREMIGRDRMKVAFFGRTSNGKSTVINAMLQKQILPTGMGHTTNCFLQVEGTDNADAFLETDDNQQEPFSVQSISERANAISHIKSEPNTVIKIHWPKDRCPLLKDDVILVDSPGIDINPDLDVWIDQFCLDADVFVLVANAESTLMQTEKNFFHKVSSRLSKPNVFILNNRWDASVLEPEYMDQVKKQHMERNVQFLADELKVTTSAEAKDRVYFVSAREALILRLQNTGVVPGTPGTPGGTLLTGFQDRLFAFQNFEKKFEECISQSAVTTKFMQHTSNGKLITSDLRAAMEDVSEKASDKKFKLEKEFRETEDRLDIMSKDMGVLSQEIRERIVQMTEEVERKVATAFVDEVKRLAILVDEFEKPFHPDPRIIKDYKKGLHVHVEKVLSRRLRERTSIALKTWVEATQHDIQERMSALLPDDARSQAAGMMPIRDFEPAYKLDCRNLCADFQEDVQFRFSFGITTLMQRYLGKRNARSVLMGGSDTIPPSIAHTPQTPSNELRPHSEVDQDAAFIMALLARFASVSAGSSVATLAVAGMVGKAAGWKVIGVCAIAYGMLYVYERLMWTNKAKERAFKTQYVEFARQKLRLIVDMMSSNCSHQVKQELQSTYSNLAHLIDVSKGDLQSQLSLSKQEMAKLDEISGKARKLRNHANYVDSELNSFIQEFLKPESRL